MMWLVILWPVAAGAALTLAFVHFSIWVQRRRQPEYLLISLAAISVAVLNVAELLLMHATSIEQYLWFHGLGHGGVFGFLVLLVWYLHFRLGTGRLWLAWTVTLLRIAVLVAEALLPYGVNFKEIHGLDERALGHGFTIVLPDVTSWAWSYLDDGSVLLCVIYVADISITTWRRAGFRASLCAWSVLVCLTIVLAAGAPVDLGLVDIPYLLSFEFLCVVLVVGYELSHDVARSAGLAVDLKESKANLALAADAANVGLWVRDVEKSEIWATQKCRTLLGFGQDEQLTIGHFEAVLHPEDRQHVTAALGQDIAAGETFEMEYRVILPGGATRWIISRGRAEISPGGKPTRIRGAVADVTPRKDSEHAAQRSRDEIAHLSRVAMIGQLTSSLAHELNQPLGAILRNAEAGELMLQNPTPDLEEIRAILADIRTDDQRAGEVIDRVRALLKRRELERGPLDLELLTGDVFRLLRPDAESRQVRLMLTMASALPAVQGDRVRLQQVLLNLLLNAMDAVRANPAINRLVTVRARQTGAAVEISVADNGTGIPADQLPRLFTPFFTSKPDGLGMGLVISRSIIEEHGGQLSVHNEPAGGATFTIVLPVNGAAPVGKT